MGGASSCTGYIEASRRNSQEHLIGATSGSDDELEQAPGSKIGHGIDHNPQMDPTSGRKKPDLIEPHQQSPGSQAGFVVANRRSDDEEEARQPQSLTDSERSIRTNRSGREPRLLPPGPSPKPPEDRDGSVGSSTSPTTPRDSSAGHRQDRPAHDYRSKMSDGYTEHGSDETHRHVRDYNKSANGIEDNLQARSTSRDDERERLHRSGDRVDDRSLDNSGDNTSRRQAGDNDRGEALNDNPPKSSKRKKKRYRKDHDRTSAQGSGDHGSCQTGTPDTMDRPKSAMNTGGDRAGSGGVDAYRSYSSLNSPRRKHDRRHDFRREGAGTSGEDVDEQRPDPRESWTDEQQIRRGSSSDRHHYSGRGAEADVSWPRQGWGDARGREDELFDKDTRIAKLESVLEQMEQKKQEQEDEKKRLERRLAVAEKKAADERRNYNGLLENRIRRDPDNQNLNDKWRLEKVLQRFKELRDNKRLEFMDALEAQIGQDHVGKTPLLQLACDIFMACFRASRKFALSVKADLEDNLRLNLELGDEVPISFSDGLVTELTFLLKEHIEGAKKTSIIENVMRKLEEKISDWRRVTKVLEQDSDGQAFLDECILLSWAMVVQHPPLKASIDDGHFDGTRHTLYSECRKEDKCIRYFVWPVVVDSVGERVLDKGVVVTRSERKGSRRLSSQIAPTKSLGTPE